MKLSFFHWITLLAMVGLMAGSMTLFQSANRHRAQRLAEIQQKQDALGELNRVLGSKAVDSKIRQLQTATAYFEAKLPQQKDIDQILQQVWQLAQANNLSTKTVKTMATENFNGYSEQPIALGLEGDFNGFYSFLLQLEREPRVMRLTRLALNKVSTQDGQVRAEMTINIFFEPESGN